MTKSVSQDSCVSRPRCECKAMVLPLDRSDQCWGRYIHYDDVANTRMTLCCLENFRSSTFIHESLYMVKFIGADRASDWSRRPWNRFGAWSREGPCQPVNCWCSYQANSVDCGNWRAIVSDADPYVTVFCVQRTSNSRIPTQEFSSVSFLHRVLRILVPRVDALHIHGRWSQDVKQ
jgi:hypothetical protein